MKNVSHGKYKELLESGFVHIATVQSCPFKISLISQVILISPMVLYLPVFRIVSFESYWAGPVATIPPNILSTLDCLDLVRISIEEVAILELTACQNSPSGFAEALQRKKAKYICPLDPSFRGEGFDCHIYGTLGHYTKDSQRIISLLLPSVEKKKSRPLYTIYRKQLLTVQILCFKLTPSQPAWNSSISLFS